MIRNRRPTALLLLFLAALAIRVAAIRVTGPARIEFGDARDYLATATTFSTTGTWPERGSLPFFRAPGLPLLIIGVTGGHPQRVAAAKIGLAVVDSLNVLLIWSLALVLSGGSRWAWGAGVAAALNPFFILQVTDIRSEPLFMALLTGALLAVLLARRDRSLTWLAATGALLGLAALTRPVALAAIPFIAVVWLLSPTGQTLRRRGLEAMMLVGVAGLVLAPWSLYLFQRYHEVIPVTDAAGYNLWRGGHPLLLAAVQAPDTTTYERLSRQFETVISPREAVRVAAEAATPNGRSRAWQRRALVMIREHPARYARSLGWKVLQFWRPWLDPLAHGRLTVLVSAGVEILILGAGLTGLAVIRRRDRWLFHFVLAWFVLAILVHAPFQVVMRFRIPFTDPLLIALGVVGAGWLLARHQGAGENSG